jgi:hypothetical protein
MQTQLIMRITHMLAAGEQMLGGYADSQMARNYVMSNSS